MARCSLASNGMSTERPPLLVVKITAFTAAMSWKSGLASSCRHAGTRLRPMHRQIDALWWGTE
jgi:hypothetical protein